MFSLEVFWPAPTGDCAAKKVSKKASADEKLAPADDVNHRTAASASEFRCPFLHLQLIAGAMSSARFVGNVILPLTHTKSVVIQDR